MTKSKPPYLLFSDVHFHNWSAFSYTNEEGVNSRLQYQIDELDRAYTALRAAGGKLAICAGDLFHVRGKMAPSVTNPVRDFFRKQDGLDMETVILSGNHDLEGNDADTLTSAVCVIQSKSTLAITEACQASVEPGIYMIPWRSDLGRLREEIKEVNEITAPESKVDLIIHAPMNDVLINIPNVGLNASEFVGMNFNRVFAGHYHAHKRLADNVYSVGATGHQTWSDPDTQAGWCLVYEDRVEFNASRQPQFMSLPLVYDEEDIVEVDGNFIRADIEDPTPESMIALREYVVSHGAAGVTIRTLVGKKESTRDGGETVSAVDSLDDSITKFAVEKHSKQVAVECARILEEARKE